MKVKSPIHYIISLVLGYYNPQSTQINARLYSSLDELSLFFAS